ncbi:MAG: FAD-dependent oxidoreductase, partial [Pseudomonadota bacterium]
MVGALSRRVFAAGLSVSAALITSQAARAQAKGRVVVVGGGYGGATAARFLKWYAPALTVVLVEPNDAYISCPFSNLVLAGERDLDAQTFSYDALAADGIERIQDRAETVDPDARRLVLSG